MSRLIVIFCCAAALAVGVAACGSSSGGKTSTATATGAQFQARLNLAKCLRAHGINVPDPSPGGGPAGGGGFRLGRLLSQYPQSQLQAARTACQQYIRQAFPFLNMSPAQRAQFQQQLVKFAQCMRAHGVNVPDPNLNGGQFRIGGGAFRSIDRNSPAFQAAATACRSLRPRFGRGGVGG